MSGRRGRPAGDRHEEPAAYEPPAEQGGPGDPGELGYGYGAEPAQYAQPQAQAGEYAGYEYRQESYQEPYVEQPYAQPYGGSYAESYAQPNPPANTQPYVESYAEPYTEPYVESYTEPYVEPGYDTYGYDGTGPGNGDGSGEGATSVMPAIVDAGPEPDAEYAATPDYASDYPSEADTEADSAYGAELDVAPARELERAYVPSPRAPEPETEPEPRPARGAARSRTARTPIWDPPGMLPALCTFGLAAVLATTALAGKPALVLGVAFLQVLTAVGWFRLNGMWPARQGIALVVLAAFATDVAVLAKGKEGLASVPAVLAVTLLVVIVVQARSGARPGDLLPALTVTASAALFAAFEVAYVVAVDLEGGPMKAGAAVVPAVVAAGVATLVRGGPLPTPIAPILAWLLGTAAGAGAGIALGGEAPLAALLGAGAAALGLIGHRVAGYDHPSRFVHFTAGVSLPLALAAPAAYLLGRVMIG